MSGIENLSQAIKRVVKFIYSWHRKEKLAKTLIGTAMSNAALFSSVFIVFKEVFYLIRNKLFLFFDLRLIQTRQVC
jgi:hypothetical protein